MMPTSVVVRWTSCTSRGTSGGTTAKNADSAENKPPAKRTNLQEVPAPGGLSRSGSSASGSAIAYSPASPFGPGQQRVRLRQSGDAAQNLRFSRGGATQPHVHVQQQVLRLGQHGAVVRPLEPVVHVEPLVIGPKELTGDLDHVLGTSLVEKREMGFRGEVGASSRKVSRVDPQIVNEGIRGVGEDLMVSALADVAVVVDPFRRNPRPVQPQRAGQVVVVAHDSRVSGIEESALVSGHRCAGTHGVRPQPLHDSDQAVVAKTLELAKGAAAGLDV